MPRAYAKSFKPGSSGESRIEAPARCRGGRIRVNDRQRLRGLDRWRRLTAPLGRQVTPKSLPTAGKDARGMWLKCGTKPSATTRKEWLKHWNCAECCSAQYFPLVLTMNGARPYNLVIRRAVRLRRDCAPLILTYVWTEPPKKTSVVRISSASRFAGRLETARFPGCLTSESEERETWTAESLRTAPRGRRLRLFSEECGHGRDFGGRRFRSSLMSISASNRRSGQ